MSSGPLRAVLPSWALLGLVMAWGCGRGVEPAPEELQVEYFGCWAIDLPGPVCVLAPSRHLELWVPSEPDAVVEIYVDDQPLAHEGIDADHGTRYPLEIPPGVSRLEVRRRQPRGVRQWSLALAEPQEPAWSRNLQALAAQGKQAEARELLGTLRDHASHQERGLILRGLGLVTENSGDKSAALSLFEQAATADRTVGRRSGEVGNLLQQVRLELELGYLAEARRRLSSLASLTELPATIQIEAAYYQGLLADAVGNFRGALAELERASVLASKLGLGRRQWMVELVRARLLRDLGRTELAEEVFAQLERQHDPKRPCDRARLLDNWAWSRLVAKEGGGDAAEPTPLLVEARSILQLEACHDPSALLNVDLNLVRAQQQSSRWSAAARALAEIRPQARLGTVRQLLDWQELAGRQALAEGRNERAAALFRDMAALAAHTASLEGELRATLGRAQVELAGGRNSSALEALEQVELQVGSLAGRIPLHQGRDTFLAARRDATRLHLDLLLRANAPQRALAVARRSRSRLLAPLELSDRLARLSPSEQESWDRSMAELRALRAEIDREAAEAWQLPNEDRARNHRDRVALYEQALARLDRAVADLGELPAVEHLAAGLPPRGEVTLLFHPLAGTGWVGFVAHAGAVSVHRFDLSLEDLGNPQRLAAKLLQPFEAQIGSAERLRILPYGPLVAVDFHALPVAGAPLVTRLPVVYGLDLPRRDPMPRPEPPTALLVSDPEGNLPAARREADGVVRSLSTWRPRWQVERLTGAAALAGDLRTALPRAELFHFAGHGAFLAADGWDSVLQLADETTLTPADILTLPRVPAWVLLSACEAARSASEAPGEGLGLAHAFLLSGSRAVVAANRPVSDSVSSKLLEELYLVWRPGLDLAQALRSAQLSGHKRDPAADWSSFRLLEP